MARAMRERHKAKDGVAGPRTIGKLAKEAKVNVETIRFYERSGMRRELKKALTACLKRSATGDCPMAQRCSPQLTVQIEPVRRRR
jgi:hypothetical protein